VVSKRRNGIRGSRSVLRVDYALYAFPGRDSPGTVTTSILVSSLASCFQPVSLIAFEPVPTLTPYFQPTVKRTASSKLAMAPGSAVNGSLADEGEGVAGTHFRGLSSPFLAGTRQWKHPKTAVYYLHGIAH